MVGEDSLFEKNSLSVYFFDIYILYKTQNEQAKSSQHLKRAIWADKKQLVDEIKESLDLAKQIYSKEILWKSFFESEPSLEKMSNH